MGSPLSSMDQKENLNDKDLNLTVVLPGGVEKMTTVPGSKPMMDLLVMLCAKYHLNPANHTMELISPNRNHIKFKPNALIGTLEADKILLKPKGVEDKGKKTGPHMPEATVRLIINYKRTQKTILRVSPRVPIEELMPAICEKCEFDPKTSVLLRDVWSEEPLDLTKSLNDFGFREVYAKDTNAVNSPVSPLSLTREGDRSPSFKSRSFKEKENKGFFGMFRRSRKKSEQSVTASAPTSPLLSRARPASMPLLGASVSVYNSNVTLSDVPKKRRAPLPPTVVSHHPASSVGEDRPHSPTESLPDGDGAVSGLRRGSTKRRAPPPPSSTFAVIRSDETPEEQNIKVGSAPHSPLEEISELEEMAVSSTPETSTATNVPMADASPDALNDAPGDSGKIEPPSLPIEEDDLPPPPPPPPQFLDGFDGDEGNDLSSDGKPADEEATIKECTEQRPVDPETPELEQSDSAGPELSPPAEAEPTLSSEAGVTALGDEMKSDSGACEVPAPSSPEIPPLPQPPTRDASSLTAEQETRDTPEDGAVKVEAPTVDGPTPPAGVISSPPPDVQPASSPPPSSPGEAARPKRDMATSTEELPPRQEPPASPQPPNSQPIYLLDYAPKPKPSNEVTRDYIPKVGLTTYTIVPQKSLRFYEVELTLEAQGSVPGQIVALGPQQCLAGVPAEQLGLHSPTLRVGPPLSNGGVAGGDGGHVNAVPVRPAPATVKTIPPPLRNVGTGPAPMAGVQPKKTPPPTKPKPGSFRLSMQKRTSGYVTSAAVKSANASHASRPAEVPGRVEAGQPANGPEQSFPPPPPPVVWTEQEETKTQEQCVDGPQPGLHAPAARLASRPADHTSHGTVPASRPANTTLGVTHPTSGPARPAPNVTAPTPRPVSLPANATLPAPRPAHLAPTVKPPAHGLANSTSSVGVPPASTASTGPRLTRQYSLPARDPSSAMTLERLRGLMVPKPYAPASQSRFARAVTTAMRRSHSLNRGSTAEPQPPRVLPPSPLADQPSIKELAEPSRTVDQEAWEGVEGKTVAPRREEEPECETGAFLPWRMHGGGEQSATRDAPADRASPGRESDFPAVPEALPQNGKPTEI